VTRAFGVGALGLLLLAFAGSAEAGFAFRKQVTIDGSRVVGGPHLDFPVLVTVVDPNLRTVAAGGGVQNASGYDITFRAADGTTVLDYEIEFYDGSGAYAGTLTAWVRLPGTLGPPDTRVQSGVDTVFYIYYGDPTIGCCQTRQGWVWDANYRYVYHFTDWAINPVTTAPVDATKNGVGSRVNPQGDGTLSLTWGDMGSPILSGAWDLATPPTILPGEEFLPTTDTFLSVRDGTLAANQPYTIEAWFRMDGPVDAGYVGIVTKGRDGGFNDWVGLWVTGNGTTPPNALALGNFTGGDVLGTTTLVAGQFYYGAVTSIPGSPATRRVFLYDVLQQTDSTTNAPLAAVLPSSRVGDDSNGNWLDGKVDEVRFSNVARSPEWLQTTARNQACSTTTLPAGYNCQAYMNNITAPFLTVGAQQAVAPNNFTMSDCCRVTTGVAGSKTTVTTSSLQMVWDTAFGAGLSELYSEEEANATVNRRGDETKYNVFTMQVNDALPDWHFERDGAGTLQVVESSPARVRLRQTYDYSGNLHLDRTWTVGSYPRIAIDETFVVDSDQAIRGAQGLHPKGETTCADTTFGNTFYCAGNADGTNRFWLVTDNQATYGDMLAIPYNNTLFVRAGAGGNYQQSFEGPTTPSTYYARVHEPGPLLSMLAGPYRNLYQFYPRLAGLTSSGTEWQPYVNEYRNPDSIGPVTLGSGWFDTNENTAGPGDFYNQAEGAYVFDMNPATGLSFDLDGGTTARLRPFFKIRQWRSLAPNGNITLEATNLQYGTHYTSAVKPLSRAYSCPTAACATSTSRANGGLAGTSEFLADGSAGQNFTLDFSGTNYQYFGSDSKFRGLNVLLSTPGVGTGLDLFWEYWNGSVWTSLEAVAGFTDQTANFTAPGTVFWTVDPSNWAKRTVVAGDSLGLYWVRVSRIAGSYTTSPVEAVIKTDILLFQYCADITADFLTFSFFPPVPTAVRLLSFGAEPADGAVDLAWRTGSELDNLGFHLYRGLSSDGPWTRLTASVIPGLGSSPLGASYAWHDPGLNNGVRYYYRLEDVDTASRSTFHGPVSAVPQEPSSADGEGGNESASGSESSPAPSGCPAWVLAQLGASAPPVSCKTHGDPFASSVRVVSRSARAATVELLTGGFVVARDASSALRVLVPGFELASDPSAPALPMRRVLVDAQVGQGVRLDSLRATDLVGYPGLRLSAAGAPEMTVLRDGTVRAGRRSVALRGAGRGRLSYDAARLAGVVFQGEDKRAVVEIQPFRFDVRQQRLMLARRVVVRLSFAGRERAETGRGSLGRRRPRPAPAREVLAELFTSRRGLHAVAFEEVFPQRRRPIAATELRLERQGEAVPLHLEPAGTDFGPGSRLFFHAERAASSTAFSAETAYQLVRSAEGLRMATRSAAPSGAPVSVAAFARAELEQNRYYQPGLLEAEDVWQWETLASGASRTIGFALRGVEVGAGEPAALSVSFQGASDAPEVLDHHLRVSLNGVFVGEATFDGRRPHLFEAPVSAATLREGANELTLENAGDTGVSSFVFLDRFAVGFPRNGTLQDGVFEGRFPETGSARVAGSTGPAYVLEWSAGGGAPTWLTGWEALPGALRFEARADHIYLAVSGLGLGTPRVAKPAAPTLRDSANQADYLVVTPRAFLAAAEPLLERRRSQGLRARAVALEEIASVFGAGEASGEAVRSFLSFAFHSWVRPSPRYLLLLGDSSYDPRNFIGSSRPAPLPALWTKTSYLWTVSDPALAAVNGEDALPDVAIGRLPAATVEEAAALVRKQLDWEDSGQDLLGPAALVADNPDAGGDFEADVADIEASFLRGREVARLLVRERGAATRDAIRGAFDGGLSLASYVGHGGAAVWASENVLNSWDAASLLAQPRQPLLLTLNCLNGYFVAPGYDSLAEAFLKVEGRGAIAAVSPSGLSLDAPAHAFHRALMTQLTSGAHARLGDALVAAQKAYAGTGAMPELLSVYQLLGDPALRIQ
jgi:hypothetical protein